MMAARSPAASSLEAESLRRWLAEVGRDAGANGLVAWVPAPAVTLSQAALRAPSELELAWSEPAGHGALGFGTAAVLTADGPGRFEAVQRASAELLATTTAVARGPGAPRVRLYGGFAFAPGGAARGGFRAFGDARFVLPRIVYTRDGDRAWLGLAGGRGEPESAWLADVERVLELVASLVEPAHRAVPAATRTLREHADLPALGARLEAARAAIASGALGKVVVAHRQELDLAAAPDPRLVLGRLIDENPSSITFAFRAGEAWFLGATPERLVSRTGLHLAAEALAGSAQRAAGADSVDLLLSEKDLAEHRFVVRAIAAILEPLTTSLDIPRQPTLRQLSNVVHLRTPIAGVLAEALPVLELVRRLHPTPAVGGTPTEAALAWLGEHEPTPRGWYAAPVGWLDREGDGDFVVALRSGLLVGAHAELQAGAGVIDGSEPVAEMAEIELKLATFRAALGIAGP